MTIELASDNLIELSSLRLIGIHGHAGVGKDTAAIYLGKRYQNCWGESFAKPLKKACAEMLGIPLDHFNDPEIKEKINSFWGKSPRQFAQYFGTELVRQGMAPLLGYYVARNFWVDRLEGRLTGAIEPPEGEGIYEPGDTVVITDVRFQNEQDWIIKNRGFILHITRNNYEGRVGIPGHESESGIKMGPETTWYIPNNGTMEEFHARLDDFAQHIGLTLKETEVDPFPL